jgi:penicillin-binding protein 2
MYPMEDNSLNRNEKISAIKLHASQYVVALVMLVLGCGLWRLQVLGSDNYRVLAEQNRIRKEPVTAPRGRIFDREGHPRRQLSLRHLLSLARPAEEH